MGQNDGGRGGRLVVAGTGLYTAVLEDPGQLGAGVRRGIWCHDTVAFPLDEPTVHGQGAEWAHVVLVPDPGVPRRQVAEPVVAAVVAVHAVLHRAYALLRQLVGEHAQRGGRDGERTGLPSQPCSVVGGGQQGVTRPHQPQGVDGSAPRGSGCLHHRVEAERGPEVGQGRRRHEQLLRRCRRQGRRGIACDDLRVAVVHDEAGRQPAQHHRGLLPEERSWRRGCGRRSG